MKNIALLVISFWACSDPVTSGAINALPGENPNAPVGEFHRAGQPCVAVSQPERPRVRR